MRACETFHTSLTILNWISASLKIVVFDVSTNRHMAAPRDFTRVNSDQPRGLKLHSTEGPWSMIRMKCIPEHQRKPFLGQKPSLVTINRTPYANATPRSCTGFYLSCNQQIPTIALVHVRFPAPNIYHEAFLPCQHLIQNVM